VFVKHTINTTGNVIIYRLDRIDPKLQNLYFGSTLCEVREE